MESMIRFQSLDEAVCISLHANTLGKGMNSLAVGKYELGNPTKRRKTLNQNQLYTT